VPREHLTITRALKSVDPTYYCAHFGQWDESMETSPAEAGYDESDGVTGNHTGDQMNWEEKRERHAKGHRLPLHAREPLEDPKESFSVTDRAVTSSIAGPTTAAPSICRSAITPCIPRFNLERAVARQRIVQLIHSHRFTEKPRRTLRVRLRFFSNR
jgi:hypothetical protein